MHIFFHVYQLLIFCLFEVGSLRQAAGGRFPPPFQSDVRMWCRRRRPGKEGAVACHWFLSNNKYLHICFSSDSGKAAMPQSAHVLFSTALLLRPYCLHLSSGHRAGSYSNVLIIQMWLWISVAYTEKNKPRFTPASTVKLLIASTFDADSMRTNSFFFFSPRLIDTPASSLQSTHL